MNVETNKPLDNARFIAKGHMSRGKWHFALRSDATAEPG